MKSTIKEIEERTDKFAKKEIEQEKERLNTITSMSSSQASHI